ncbi:MAG TPA: hypothetical protein VFI12_05940 [Thermomicrobiales bacterium]|nr:hypothetical protein [Thermomicrobiales bacterium]
MKQIGVREFRDHATTYLSGPDPVAVSKHGRIIGFYIPLKRDEEAVRRAIDKFGKAIDQVRQEAGLTEEELIDMLGLST